MDSEEVKSIAFQEIDRRAHDIQEISKYIQSNPETGFREYRTSEYVASTMEAMDLTPERGLALTGVKATMRGRSSRSRIAILGELDALLIPDNPFADPGTGAAHACGHNAQPASMLGAGMGLARVMRYLDGDVVLFGVPAEEMVEVQHRLALRAEGKIEFIVGKAELARLGHFSDIDIAMLTHTQVGDGTLASVGDTHNGALAKFVTFRGRSAHAGSRPWLGVNALKAASLALSAIDAQRETFRESSTVRIHYIITKGGDGVTAVPDDVRVEMLVRARTLASLREASDKVDRSLRAGALALGAQVEIESISGYMPHMQDPNLIRMVRRNCVEVVGEENMGSPVHRTGSTDLGDISQIMPVVHPRSGGAHGSTHTREYYIEDHYAAAVNPAKWMAATVIDLLWDGAKAARDVVRESAPKLSLQEYLQVRRELEGRESFGEVAALPEGAVT